MNLPMRPNTRHILQLCILASALAFCSPLFAQDDEQIKDVIIRSPEDIAKTGGSTQVVDEKQLEAQEHDDIHSLLLQIPGVYVRQEDGFGLRPNIGIRGASSERSKKVTLMEDGVLFGPAPYSAPAAYYFPIMTRMVGMEVFKGPSAVLFGPQTIGGAINVVTRPVPVGHAGGLDLSIGSFPAAKLHLWHGYGDTRWGVLVEGVQLWSAGFKSLDGAESTFFNKQTGFDRSEVMFKGFVTSDPTSTVFHKLTLKATYSRERSDETYMGLTDADFEQDPNRRYAGSALDKMDWWRLGFRLDHRMEIGANFNLVTSAYRHDFQRSWKKFNNFSDGTSAADVLDNPGSARNAIFYDVLRGQANSSTNSDQLIIGTNARDFVSQGVQTVAKYIQNGKKWSNKLEAGIRVHQDSIVRDHTEERYNMTDGQLVRTSDATTQPTNNEDSALAVAAWAADQVSFWRMVVTPGIRMEYIATTREDLKGNTTTDGSQFILIPGLGTTLDVGAGVSLLAGAYRGFSPVAPGQPDEVEPETSLNYEFGLRYAPKWKSPWFVRGEAIGFFNDYRNLVGQCTFAAGCQEQDLDDQFNAGRAFIYGGEFVFGVGHQLNPDHTISLNTSYTLTKTSFRAGFSSKNPQYSNVEEGDEMPYVPTHQASVTLNYDTLRYGGNLNLTYVGQMREEASQGDEGRKTDAYTNVDLMLFYSWSDPAKVYFKVENILNARPVASRRPFGARPIRPRFIQLGFKYDWGSAVRRPWSPTSIVSDEDEEIMDSSPE